MVSSVVIAVCAFVLPAQAAAFVSPPAGGLDAVEVTVDASEGVVRIRRCRSAGCADPIGPGKEIKIPIEKERIDSAGVRIEAIPIGEGRSIVRTRVPDMQRKELAFEVLASGQGDDPIWSGLTGYTQGAEGDRAGQVVLVYDRGDKTKFVLVAEQREDTRICGQQTTPLGARGIEAKSMQLRGATLHRIEKKARDAAQRVVGQLRANEKPPLGRVLLATGGSAPGAVALTDGNAATAWAEQRPGDGHGEFATLRAPSEVPIHALVVTVAPTSPKPQGAAPRTFFVATDEKLLHVTMPEDGWSKAGTSYEIPFPEPVKTTCVAVVLDEAYDRGMGAPEVSIAEIAATTKFDLDGASLDDVAKELAGKRGDEAAALLKRAGNEGLAAVAKRYGEYDARARAQAIDVAASAGTCEGAAMELLTRALTDKEVEVKRRALGRIERCGKAAGESLVIAVRSGDEARCAAAAPLLATVAPSIALEPLAEQMGKGAPETRRAVRGAFARAAQSTTRDRLLALITNRDLSHAARLDLVRAVGAKLAILRPESDVAISDLLRGNPAVTTRYLVAQPLAHLARSHDATSGELTKLAELARRDPEWAVRARAVEMCAGIGALGPTIVSAVGDQEPRVREAALRAIATTGVKGGTAPAAQALASDPWTFVRVAAAEALGAMPQDLPAAQALAKALEDPSPKVRYAAVAALGKQHATSQAEKIQARLDDTKEDVDVRALAARTLGVLCVQGAVGRLTKLAMLARQPVGETDDRLGMAAIDALGALHPSDLEKRLAPLRAKDARMAVRRAADRAVSEAGSCR